jgi:hypothetical protein
MPRIVWLVALLVASAAPVLAAKEKDYYHPLWASRAYVPKPFPAEWRPQNPPQTETDLAAFEKYDLRVDPFSIRAFVARYGIPQRYLVSTGGSKQNFLIYDLPSGHSVALYVYKPPADTIEAAIIIDSHGKLLRLIK